MVGELSVQPGSSACECRWPEVCDGSGWMQCQDECACACGSWRECRGCSACRRKPEPVRAPFPYFGGKSGAAKVVWDRFGDVDNYLEPFAGSLAVLLARPHAPHTETVNDIDCYLTNFWRAVRAEPEAVAEYADWPVSELDQNARHRWLVNQSELRERMNTEPDFYDVKAAGWWVWGQNIWIGDGWCNSTSWTKGKLPHLGDAGTGIHRRLPHLGNAGKGIHRQAIENWLLQLQQRLRRVRICCGDWTRVLTPSVATRHGVTGVFLDPPYLTKNDAEYAIPETDGLQQNVRQWAVENGRNSLFRIALCGYQGEYEMPSDWECFPWKARKGYQAVNGDGTHGGERERIWFSPHCLRQNLLFYRSSVGDGWRYVGEATD